MTERPPKQVLITRWSRAAYATIAVALALMLICGIWATLAEVRYARMAVLERAVDNTRSQAMRRVGHLETTLEREYQGKQGDVDWRALRQDEWIERYWEGVTPLQDHEVYVAIVSDPQGIVILHSKPDREGGRLGRRWYDHKLDQFGSDVVEASDNALSDGRRVIDVQLPILVDGREVGAYHEGIDDAWLQTEMDRETWRVAGKWASVVAAMTLALALAVVSLVYIASRKATLVKAVRLAQFENVLQIENLAAGLAHEIRNPLHALRLNLHAISRAWSGKTQLSNDDLASMIAESNREIDRVERLLQELLGFAKPEAARNETLSVGNVTQATVNFLREEMRRKDVAVETSMPASPVYVRMDQGRLRQVLINLLGNALDAVQQGGRIQVSVGRRGGRAEVVVSDDGPGVEEENREKIFEPFFSTKGNGSGFGLALVRKFVEDAGGHVACESNEPHGARFRIQLPLVANGLRRESPSEREPS